MNTLELMRSKAITARIYYGPDSDEYRRRQEAYEGMESHLSTPSPATVGRIYLSGPITGRPNGNREAFHLAWNELHAQGYHAINPCNIEQRDDWQWADYMRQAIRWMMGCDSIVMLPGWHNSKGAQIEHRLALDLGMAVYYWIDGKLNTDILDV